MTQTGCVNLPNVGLNPPLFPQVPDGTIGTINAPAAQPAAVPVEVVLLVVVAVVVVAVVEVVALVRELVDEVAEVPLALEVEVAVLPLLDVAVDVVMTPLVTTVVALDVEPAVYVPVLPLGLLVALVARVLLEPGVMSAAVLFLGESPGSAAHAKNWMTGSTKTACFKQRRRLIGGPFSFGGRGRNCAAEPQRTKLLSWHFCGSRSRTGDFSVNRDFG